MPKRIQKKHSLWGRHNNGGHLPSKPNPQRNRTTPRKRSTSGTGRKRSNPSTLSESSLEEIFLNYWTKNFGPKVTQQHKFNPKRQWRFDFCWPDLKIAVEIQGFGEGHNSYNGMASDYEKHNNSLFLGWRIIYLMSKDLTPETIYSTCDMIQHFLEGKMYASSNNNPRLVGPNDSILRARGRLTERID